MASIRTAAAPACLLMLLAAAPAHAAPASVAVENDSFSPGNVAIDAGETVTWDFREGGHNVDVYEGPQTWRSSSGKNAKGTQATHAFDQAGTYRYVCDYHGGMKGTIAVAARPEPTPAPQPKPTPKPSPLPTPPLTPVTITPPAATDRSADPVDVTTRPAPVAADAAAPTVRRLATRPGRLRLKLSERAQLTIRLRSSRLVTKTVAARRGINAIPLRAGRYRVSVVARDAAGNASGALRFVVRIPR